MKLFDLGAVSVAIGLALLLTTGNRHSLTLKCLLSLQIRISNIFIYGLLLLIWHCLFRVYGLYESKRLTNRADVAKEIILATGLGTISLKCADYVAHISFRDPTFLAFVWVCSAVMLLGSRLILYYWLGVIRRNGRNSRYILILGTNARAKEFAHRILSKPEMGYRLVGFVDDAWPGTKAFEEPDSTICCHLSGLEEFLRWHVVDEVAMYLPLRSSYEHAARVASVCERHGLTLRLAPDLFNLRLARHQSHEFDDHQQNPTLEGGVGSWPFLLKRLLDFTLSSVLLVLFSPLFLVISALVKGSSSGPVFFHQKRLGLNKRQFVMYKFRTMVPNAEKMQDAFNDRNEMSGPVFKIKKDPRITPIGRILRKTSLDELPQLWNVMRGDMSLVGPRAMSVRDFGLFPQDWQRRFSVPPGITCLWQVNGRNSVPFETWMEMDMEYIDRWSFWLDLKILVRTIPAVIRGAGAV